jgi:hypothetical protein
MIKMSLEIYNKIKSPDIATVIDVCRLELLEYVVRMDGVVLMEGKRGGGIYFKAMDDVKLNLRNMGVKRCRTRAWDRTERAPIMQETQARLKGLHC